MVIKNLHKIRRNIDDYGLWRTLRKMLNVLIGPIYIHRKYTIYAIDLHASNKPNDITSGLVFKLITAQDKRDIRQVEEMAEWMKDKIVDKLSQGGLCLVALSGRQVAGFNLVTFGHVEIPLLMMEKKFDDQQAWSEQISVHKAYRKKGLASELRYRVFDALKERGIKTLYGGALHDNVASLRLAEKVGFKKVADITLIRILGKKQWRYSKEWK